MGASRIATRQRETSGLKNKEQTMEVDLPEVVAEVKAAFERYEKALVSNDVPVLDELFRDDPCTIRYGVNEILYGYAEIRSFRGARSPVALGRKLSRTVITTYGRDFAVASTLYERPSALGKLGRQTQTWVKFAQGWRVVSAHVSLMDKPAT
jgi:AtzH-like